MPCFCRVHTPVVARQYIGQDVGNPYRGAEIAELQPRIVWWLEDMPAVERGGVVSLAGAEAYSIDLIEPTDRWTVTTPARRLRPAETVGLPVP